jgi:hypothetical protein
VFDTHDMDGPTTVERTVRLLRQNLSQVPFLGTFPQDFDPARLQIQVAQIQAHGLAHAQAMAEHHKHEQRVAPAVPPRPRDMYA